MDRMVATMGCAEYVEDLNAEVVVLSDETTGDRFELQRSIEFDDQDRAVGMDTYCVCMPWGATHYGGIGSWREHDGVLEISFTEEAAKALGMGLRFQVEMRMGPGLADAVVEGMRRIVGFAGDDSAT